MAPKKNASWLKFVHQVSEIPLGFSQDELMAFRNFAKRESPSLMPVIEAYIKLADHLETSIKQEGRDSSQAHLFDLLRERKFFPKNLDLARFASRVLPHLKTHRFDKMSRGDIASRIIEHIEGSDPEARGKLEASMRDAFRTVKQRPPKAEERQSFLSKWERIIKGVEL